MKDLKHLPIEFDAKAVKEDGTFEGYASVFNNVDQGNDVVLPGAFTKSLQNRPAARVKMLWQHDPKYGTIGKWSVAGQDSKGLFVSGALYQGAKMPNGVDIVTAMKSGDLDGLSIGYRTKDSDYDHKLGVRKLKTLELHEISLVTFPMNEEATISAVKESDFNFNPTEWEKILREEGLSGSAAKRAVHFFKKRLRDAGGNVEPDPREAEAATHGAETAALARLIEAMRA